MKKITLLLCAFITVSVLGQVKLTSSLSEYEVDGIWLKSSQELYEYSNGNLTTQTYQNWDTSNSVWVNSESYNYTYNGNNKLTVEIDKEWNTNTNLFENKYKTEYSYNTNGKVEGIFSYEWATGQWVLDSKFEINYDSNNRLSNGLGYTWNGAAYELEERTVISYNANNTISQSVFEEWDGANWQNSDITTYSYNVNNKLVLELTKTWNGVTFIDEDKTEYTYDANENLTNELNSYIDNGVWVVGGNGTYTYDATQQLSNYTHPFVDRTGLDYIFSGFPYVNKLLTSSYSNNDRTTYFYAEVVASLKDIKLESFNVYPNPTTSLIKIDDSNFSLKNIELFNTQGKRVMKSTKNQLNLENLVDGMYLLKVVSEEGNFATKRIIKN